MTRLWCLMIADRARQDAYIGTVLVEGATLIEAITTTVPIVPELSDALTETELIAMPVSGDLQHAPAAYKNRLLSKHDMCTMVTEYLTSETDRCTSTAFTIMGGGKN